MKQIILMGLLGLIMLGLTSTPLQADFVQCPGGGACGGAEGTTDNADLINGTDGIDGIDAQGGNDLALGGSEADNIIGGDGNDTLFGGPGLDFLFGDAGNDVLLAGPDNGGFLDNIQNVFGGTGNDSTHVLVSEISGCLVIEDDGGADTVNLVGFGPYSATTPFGDQALGDVYAFVVDPITSGVIVIDVNGNDDTGVETINGLLSPDIVFVPALPIGLCELQG
jgi:hypothetical protein